MKIIIKRDWWRFWRHPLFGLNPFAWVETGEIDPSPAEGAIVRVEGYRKPGDGASGSFRVVKFDKEKINNGTIVSFDKSKRNWVRQYETKDKIQ